MLRVELRVEIVACLEDNYAYVVRDEQSGKVAVVDPSEAAPVAERLQTLGWPLDYILNTHHHPDHVGGNAELKRTFGAEVIASHHDKTRVPVCDRTVGEGGVIHLGATSFTVMEIPGHTLGHIAFYDPQAETVFTGDTLFSLGCGRLFEGTPAQMWSSLQRLAALPPQTKVYCGHEYTQGHLKFVEAVDPSNPSLPVFKEKVTHLRTQGKPTVPTSIAAELALNPFLRPQSPALQQRFGGEKATPLEVFTALRLFKNNFKG